MSTSKFQMPADSARIVGVLANMVPYHHARWQEFASSRSGQTTVLEVASGDAFKVLETLPRDAAYARLTLFKDSAWSDIPGHQSRVAVFESLSRLRPQVVCLSGYGMSFSIYALEWCCLNKVPVVLCSESNSFDAPRKLLQETIKKRILDLCSAALVGGRTHADYLQRLGMKPDEIFLGYDIVDNLHFSNGAENARAESSRLRRELDLPERYFVACSRFEKKKNHFRLIEAYARYRSVTQKTHSMPNRDYCWPLVLVGDGKLRPQLESQISALGLDEDVILAGARRYNELPAYYGLASCFIHPSTTEQWGLVVNEAMASGLPVLVSNGCGCVAELVREGINGFTFNALDVDELAQLMFRVSASDFQRNTLALASQRVIGDWGPRRFALGLTAAVEMALKAGAKHGRMLDRMLLRLLPLHC